MKIKTSELTGAALDWAVQKCEGLDYWKPEVGPAEPSYSTNWAQGGPIIERECIALTTIDCTPNWEADIGGTIKATGPTPLIAAMRCYVASVMGDEVDVPEELEAA